MDLDVHLIDIYSFFDRFLSICRLIFLKEACCEFKSRSAYKLSLPMNYKKFHQNPRNSSIKGQMLVINRFLFKISFSSTILFKGTCSQN